MEMTNQKNQQVIGRTLKMFLFTEFHGFMLFTKLESKY